MASSKKKQDEKHLKILRQMVALAHNKQCIDCHQRGPTYINMTIGSYVCTACSGLLRGLNPPHRVKSISMASFTPEEMDFIKCHGNEFCRKVWLGLYDNRLGNQSESREETKVKDFMMQKYEKKRYYVAPTDSLKEEAKRMNESVLSKTPGTRPLKSLLGENAPKLQVGTPQEPSTQGVVSVDVHEGFFGGQGQPNQPGGLFGGQGEPNQTGGLFRGQGQTNQPEDLFGGQGQPNQPGLFGGQFQPNQPGGLFPAAQTSGNDLFTATAGSVPQPQQNVFAPKTDVPNPDGNMFATSYNSPLQMDGKTQSVDNLFAGTADASQTTSTDLFASTTEGFFGSTTNTPQPLSNSLFDQTTSVGQQPVDLMVGTQMGPKSMFTPSSGVTSSTGDSLFAENFGTSGTDFFVGKAENPFSLSKVTQNHQSRNQNLFDGENQEVPCMPGLSGLVEGDLFTGQIDQGQADMFNGTASPGQGQCDIFGSHGNRTEASPNGDVMTNIEGQCDILSVHPSSKSQSINGVLGTQPSHVLTNSVEQEPKPVSATPPPISSTPQSPGNQSVQSSKSSGSTAMDLLGDLGGDPFASSTPQTQHATGGFADFGNFGNTGSQSATFPPVTQQPSQPPPFAQGTPLQPFGSSSSSSSTTASQNLNGSVAPATGGGDKYSNLSDLFSSATTTEAETSAPTGWSLSSTSTGGGGGEVGWNSGNSSTATGPINWGGDSSSNTSAGSINWNSSSTQSSSNTGVGWGGGSNASYTTASNMAGMSWGVPATAQSNGLGAPGNPFLQQNNVANPFGGGSGTSLTTQTNMGGGGGTSNPFGGQQAGAQPGGFGAFGSQAGGFGQVSAQQNPAVTSSAGQFGQFGGMQNGGFGTVTSAGGAYGSQTNTQAGFGQPGQQQFGAQPSFGQQKPADGFGGMPQGAGFGNQPTPGFGQPVPGYGVQPQMQGFGAPSVWGQAPTSTSANPFMSTAQQYSTQPTSGTTNPFL